MTQSMTSSVYLQHGINANIMISCLLNYHQSMTTKAVL